MINTKHKFILLLPQKTGSSSIVQSMKNHGIIDETKEKHRTLKSYVKNWKGEWGNISEYTIATTVRNCYERLVSKHQSKPYLRSMEFAKFCSRYKKQIYDISFYGPYAPDVYINFDNLQNDYDKFCAKVGIKNHKLPKLNSSNNKVHYSRHYNNEARRIVENNYEDDILIFGFKFENE